MHGTRGDQAGRQAGRQEGRRADAQAAGRGPVAVVMRARGFGPAKEKEGGRGGTTTTLPFCR